MKQYIVKYGDKEFKASHYQNLIFDNVEHGHGNMIISAAAGSSKTTTIVNCINIIKETKRLLFIAFNKDIVDNIRERIGDKPNAKISTFHSMGYSIFKENHADSEVNEFKYRNYVKKNIDTLTNFNETKSLKHNKITYINNIISLIDYCRYYLAFSKKEIENIADKYNIIILRDEVDVVRKVLKWGKSHLKFIDYTDMLWLPNVLNYTTKRYLFDWILIDEAQDTTIAEQKLIEKCFKRGTRFIVVGDSFQTINIWAGSSEEAIKNFEKLPNTMTFKLPISYRCPKKIVELASKYSNNIIATDDAIDGDIRHNVSKNVPTNGDMVLCRMTSPLINLHLHYMRINKKSYVKGFENIKEQYFNLINQTGSELIDKECKDKHGLIAELYYRLFREIDNVKKCYELDNEDSIMHPLVFSIYDAIKGIEVISEGLTTVEELKNKINVIFSGDDKDAVQLSTVHKSKGLEADNVFILKPSLMPSKLAKRDWEILTEKNLIYVAITRAKKSLNYIEEEKYNNFSNINDIFDIKAMKTTIEIMRSKLKYDKFKETPLSKKTEIIIDELQAPKVLGENNPKTVSKRTRKFQQLGILK